MCKTICSFLIILTSLLIAGIMPVMAVEEGEQFETAGEISAGVQQIWNNDAISSKFNEYRDIRDGFNLYKLNIEGFDTKRGRYLEFRGTDLLRTDQNIILRGGAYGRWGLEIEWDEVPHLLSNKAKTPYNYQGNGLYTVPANAGITKVAPTTAEQMEQDTKVSDFLNIYLHPTDLGTQRKKGSTTLTYTPTASLKFTLGYSDERKEGTKITGAPIGDRPPRTMNTQIPEPVDYQTRDLRFDGEYVGDTAQIQLSYLLSQFENNAQSLTWQSLFYGAAGGPDFNNTLGRTASTYGRTALYPDNMYHNFILSLGFNLPMDSRLTASASYGLMEQDEDLLPYSYSTLTTDWNSLSKLPRTKADAEIQTIFLNASYMITPIDRLNLRPFYRHYKLDNNTRTDEWYYVTSDTATTTGGTAVSNQRKNLAHGFEKQNYGLDAYYSIYRSTFGLSYEREDIDRDFREANTKEDIFKASLNTRLTNSLSFRMKYLHGDRDGGSYNGEITDQSYHLSNAVESGTDRPYSAFGNHPDLRKFDVSDRERNHLDASITVNPINTLNVSLAYNYRKDDHDSDVESTQPLAGTSFGAASGTTPGTQLGLLENKLARYSVDANYAPTERLSFNIFTGREEYKSKQRGMAFDENKRTAANFDWNDATRHWMARISDKTDTFGVGAGSIIIRGKLNFALDYSYSYGTIDIDYSGYGSDKPLNDNTFYYAFANPDRVSHRQDILNATLEYQMFKGWIAGLGYLYDRYKIKDWMQEPSGGWVEPLSDYYWRDSSQDNRWGNRLVTMGSYLGPSYEAHVGLLTMTYKW